MNLQTFGLISDPQIAGFFDGEGTFSFGSPKCPRCKIEISQSSPEILNAIRDYLGYGTVRKQMRLVGGILMPVYRFWVCSAAHILDLTERMLPHLWVKRPQALLTLEFVRTIGQRHHIVPLHIKERRLQIVQDIRNLKLQHSAKGR